MSEFEHARSSDVVFAQVNAMETSVDLLRQQLSNAADDNLKSKKDILNLNNFIADRNHHINELKSNL
jgi:peptidoglycan hydrolase CwlO-like protein